MSNQALALLLALVSVISYSISNFLVNQASISSSPQRMVLSRNITTTILLLMILIISKTYLFIDKPLVVLYAIVVSCGIYIGFVALIKAFSLGRFGLLSAISEAKFIPSILVFWLIFNNTIQKNQWIAAIIAVIGLVVLFVNPKTFQKITNEKKAMSFVIVNAFFFGTGFALLFWSTQQIGPNVTGFISEASLMVFALIHLLIMNKSITKGLIKEIKQNIPMGATAALGTFAYYQSQGLGDPTSLAIIMTLSPVINLFLGTFILKEKYSRVEWVGVFIIISALGILIFG